MRPVLLSLLFVLAAACSGSDREPPHQRAEAQFWTSIDGDIRLEFPDGWRLAETAETRPSDFTDSPGDKGGARHDIALERYDPPTGALETECVLTILDFRTIRQAGPAELEDEVWQSIVDDVRDGLRRTYYSAAGAERYVRDGAQFWAGDTDTRLSADQVWLAPDLGPHLSVSYRLIATPEETPAMRVPIYGVLQRHWAWPILVERECVYSTRDHMTANARSDLTALADMLVSPQVPRDGPPEADF